MRDAVCAVDVGTSSARAGIFDRSGRMLAREEHPIELHRTESGHAEHDSEDIWRAVCKAVRAARAEAGVAAEGVAAVGFDATCSLVVRGRGGGQLSVSASGDRRWDTILWLDHRALAEAEECTATGHPVLDFVGGVMSPEMQTPKLMWLKRHRPQSWAEAEQFFDLADYLTWRASGSDTRSQCTLTSKWTYLAHDGGWQRDFFDAVGLGEIPDLAGLARPPAAAGTSLGPLTQEAAAALGLDTGSLVSAGLVDAFAGALGVIGGYSGDALERHLALVGGTSSCVMCFSRRRRHVPGIWGPYYGATLPGYWQSEGGQSATGGLLDHVIALYGGGRAPDAAMHRRIAGRVREMRETPAIDMGESLHVLPDFCGSRSPVADPQARGVVSGLTMDTSFDGLCRLYWRTAVAVALGVRSILEHLDQNGISIDVLHVTGGHTRNPLLMELYADATGCTVSETTAADAVLLGTAMAAAATAGWFAGLAEACRDMQQKETVRRPNKALRAAYDRDYRIFLKMQNHRREIRSLLD